jgi:flavin-dependent dehydrogenase
MNARRLADAGHDVLVLEEHATIGAPVHCTGLMGADAIDEFDLPRDVILQRAQLETPFPARPEIEVRFGNDVAPSGFAWLVPVTRDRVPYARIGLMSATKSRERFATLVATLCASVGLDPATIPAPRLKMLPLGSVARTFADRVVAMGDAAGLVKPTTGGGIHYSLLSGSLAADVIGRACARTGCIRRRSLDTSGCGASGWDPRSASGSPFAASRHGSPTTRSIRSSSSPASTA